MRRVSSHKDDREARAADDATGARIIPFRHRSNSGGPKNADEAAVARQVILEEERVRMRQNIAVAVVLIALMCAGGWLVMHLRESLRIEACIEAGHRGCSTLHP